MEENPRQFSSIDSSDAGLHGSLTMRPASGEPAGVPIDFAAINRQVTIDRTKPDYVYKESSAEHVLRREREIASSLRFKEEAAQRNEENRLQIQREQQQRQELANRIKPGVPSDPEVAQPRPESPLSQQQRSTPERQPLPSTGSPPPTPKGTATRANSLVEPTALPAPAALAEAIPVAATGGVLSQLPRALPQAAGRLAIPGIAGGIDFANRVVHGQSLQQAGSGAIAGQIGAGIGFAAGTAAGGPLLGIAGAIVGGMIAGSISDAFFNPHPSSGSPATDPINYPPFRGGQVAGVKYNAIYSTFTPENIAYYTEQGNGTNNVTFDGKIESVALVKTEVDPDRFKPDGSNLVFYTYTIKDAHGEHTFRQAAKFLYFVNMFPAQPVSGDPIQPAPPPDNLPYNYDTSPLGDDNTVPSGTPGAGNNKGKTRNIAPSMPANNTPNGAPFFPGHGGLAPSYTPNPTQLPSNLGGMLPVSTPAREPLLFAEPQDFSIPASPSGTASRIENGVVTNPATPNAQPIPFGSSNATIPSSSSPTTGKQNATPDSASPVPKTSTAPIAKTPEETQAEKTAQTIEQQKKNFDEQLGKLTFIATAIAALTPAIQGIPDAIANSPAVQAATGTTVQGAVCEIAQPTGCLGAPIKKAEDAANANGTKIDGVNEKLNALGLAGQGVDLGLLAIINNKLGDQVPGGISKFMENIAKNTYVEKALSVLTFAITLHNGLMLSNNLAQTLGGIINTVLGLILPKGLDGTPINIGEVLGKATHEIIADSIGEANYTKLTQEWAMANRIYQASSNVFNSLTNAASTLVNALEVIGSYTAKIGNGLKKWGVLGEQAYEWFHPNPNFHNKYFTFLNNAEIAANTIQAVVQIPVSIVDAKSQIDSANTEFKSAIKGDKNPDGTPKENGIATEENKDKKDEFDLGKSISLGQEILVDDIFDAGD